MKQIKVFYINILLTLVTFAFGGKGTQLSATESDNQSQNQKEKVEKSLLFKGKEFFKKHTVKVIGSVIAVVGVVIIVVIRKNQKDKNRETIENSGNNNINNVSNSNQGTALNANHNSTTENDEKDNGKTQETSSSITTEENKVDQLNGSDTIQTVDEDTMPQDFISARKMASELQEKGKYDEAIKYYQHALGIVKDMPEKEYQEHALAWRGLGSIYTNQRKYPKALDNYKKALNIYKSKAGKNDKEYGTTMKQIGYTYYIQKKYNEALRYYNEAFEVYQKTLNKDDQEYAKLSRNIGSVYSSQGKHCKAIENFKKALSFYESSQDKGKEYAKVYQNMGLAYSREKKYNEALSCFQKSIDTYKHKKLENGKDYAIFLYNIANTYNQLKQYKKAIEHAQIALAIYAKTLGTQNKRYANTLRLIGLAYSRQEKYNDAIQKFDEAYKIDPSSPTIVHVARWGHTPSLDALQKRGDNLLATDGNGNNALYYAASLAPQGKGIVWLIKTAKIGVNSQGAKKRTAFLAAAAAGNVDALKTLKQEGADVKAVDQHGNNALHLAALFAPKGKGILWLIKTAKIGVNSKGRFNRTAFLLAAKVGNVDALKTLKGLKNQVPYVSAVDKNGHNALHLASRFAPEGKGINWLINTVYIGVDTQVKGNKRTSFMLAAQEGNVSALKILKDENADVNKTDKDGNNALHLASMYAPRGEGIEWLIKVAKIPVDVEGAKKKTPFLLAAEHGNLDALKLLKKKEAKVNEVDEEGNNVLDLAKEPSVSQETIDWLKRECDLKS